MVIQFCLEFYFLKIKFVSQTCIFDVYVCMHGQFFKNKFVWMRNTNIDYTFVCVHEKELILCVCMCKWTPKISVRLFRVCVHKSTLKNVFLCCMCMRMYSKKEGMFTLCAWEWDDNNEYACVCMGLSDRSILKMCFCSVPQLAVSPQQSPNQEPIPLRADTHLSLKVEGVVQRGERPALFRQVTSVTISVSTNLTSRSSVVNTNAKVILFFFVALK